MSQLFYAYVVIVFKIILQNVRKLDMYILIDVRIDS